MKKIEASELILNDDGSVFHLHIKPGELAENVILVGDPGRVETVAGFFDKVDHASANREFVSKTGFYHETPFTVLSTGIGTDNIDIVLNELDALVNVDFEKRTVQENHRSLNIVRIGTSGSLQAGLPVDSWVLSRKAVGFDGLLNFYGNSAEVFDDKFEKALLSHLNLSSRLATPYVMDADAALVSVLSGKPVRLGVTVSAPGFYGPQGRVIRLPLNDPGINERLADFYYDGLQITNYEMECSAIYGLSRLLGHHAATVCAIIANRQAGTYTKDYKPVVKKLIQFVLDRLSS